MTKECIVCGKYLPDEWPSDVCANDEYKPISNAKLAAAEELARAARGFLKINSIREIYTDDEWIEKYNELNAALERLEQA